ncbi:hypothetical protein TNCV_382011 [Trichonephila clavipes]|nr:hypothetical protein TNCV_382011 [Trichonephila clavipes]
MARQLLCFPLRFGSQSWRLEQPPKIGELVQSYAPFQFSHFLWTVSRMFSMVPCRGDRYYSHPVLQQTLQVKLMATMCLFWPVHRTDGAYVGDTVSGPFSA